MDLTSLLTSYGYWGMFIAALLAGSVFPFSSEAVMLALLAAGLEPWKLMVYGTLGNTLGSLFNYGLGRMGKIQWLERYFHVSQAQIDKAMHFMQGRGSWMGFFAFLPILGSAISVALGLMRSNFFVTAFSIFIGRLLLFFILLGGLELIFG